MTAIALTLALALVYLLVIRCLDLNEREPLWAIVLLFALGTMAASALDLTVSTRTLELSVLPGAAFQESAKFLAILAGVAVLVISGRVRGWSELNGPMDGIVYGAAAGLGFATAETLLRELQLGAGPVGLVAPSVGNLFWSSALVGLSHGVIGAISGAALAGAARGSGARRIVLPLLGILGAIGANAGLRALAYGNALGGTAGLVRVWIALLLPLAVVVAVGGYALRRERTAIIEELSSEVDAGVVTPEDLALLRDHLRRQGAYWGAILRGGFVRSAVLRGLHTRQVQLALTKRRAGSEAHEGRRAVAEAEADRLRASVLFARERLEALAGAVRGQGGRA